MSKIHILRKIDGKQSWSYCGIGWPGFTVPNHTSNINKVTCCSCRRYFKVKDTYRNKNTGAIYNYVGDERFGLVTVGVAGSKDTHAILASNLEKVL